MMAIQDIVRSSASLGQPAASVTGKYWSTIHTGRLRLTASWPSRVHSPTMARSFWPAGLVIG